VIFLGWKSVGKHKPIKAITKGTRLSRKAKIEASWIEKEGHPNGIRHTEQRLLLRAKLGKVVALRLNYKNALRVVKAINSIRGKKLTSKQVAFISELETKLSHPKNVHAKGEVYISVEEVASAFKLLKQLDPVLANRVLKNIGR